MSLLAAAVVGGAAPHSAAATVNGQDGRFTANFPDALAPDEYTGCVEVRIDATLTPHFYSYFYIDADIFDPTGQRVAGDAVSGDENSGSAQVLSPTVCGIEGPASTYRVELRLNGTGYGSTTTWTDFAATSVQLGEPPAPVRQATSMAKVIKTPVGAKGWKLTSKLTVRATGQPIAKQNVLLEIRQRGRWTPIDFFMRTSSTGKVQAKSRYAFLAGTWRFRFAGTPGYKQSNREFVLRRR